MAFVEACRNTGSLPINSLAMDFEELPCKGAPAVLGEVLSARVRLTPLLRLGQPWGHRVRRLTPPLGSSVVDESGDASRGLLVDQLLGKRVLLIKNLGETFRQQDLLAGAAILGDDRGELIMDVDTLM